MTDDFTAAARTEAERIFPTSLHLGKFDGLMSDADIDRRLLIQRQAFELGTEWARTHLAAQVPQVTIVQEEGKPATCEVRQGGVLIFSGRDHSADARAARRDEETR